MEADTLDLELNNKDAQGNELSWPPRGRELSVWIGYADQDLHYKGRFVVDELSYDIAGQVLGVHAKSADVMGQGKVQRSQSWKDTTLGTVLGTLAGRNGWQVAVSDEYQQKRISFLAQHDESDLHLLSRLGLQYGAVAQVKNGSLIFVATGSRKTAKGQLMPVFTIPLMAIGEGGQYQEMGRGYYTGVRARYSGEGKSGTVRAGSTRTLYQLRDVFDTRDAAQDAVNAEMKRINGNNNTLSIPLDHGWPAIVAEAEIQLDNDWPEVIRKQKWATKSVTHSLGDGLSTRLECVKPGELYEDQSANSDPEPRCVSEIIKTTSIERVEPVPGQPLADEPDKLIFNRIVSGYEYPVLDREYVDIKFPSSIPGIASFELFGLVNVKTNKKTEIMPGDMVRFQNYAAENTSTGADHARMGIYGIDVNGCEKVVVRDFGWAFYRNYSYWEYMTGRRATP